MTGPFDQIELRNLVAGSVARGLRGPKQARPLQDQDFAAADEVLKETRFHCVVALPPRVPPAWFWAGGLLQPVTLTNPILGVPVMVRQGDDVFLEPRHARAMRAALIAAARLAEEVQAEFDAQQAANVDAGDNQEGAQP